MQALGTGATAVVWRAVDDSGRELAIKLRKRGDPATDRRFLREFESMRTLRLPGVVRVYDAGFEEELLWFTMDLVHGEDFYDDLHRMASRAERVGHTLSRGARLLHTLAELHQAGFIHRDLKPSNVLVTGSGDVHVLDFGIVRFFASDDSTLSTQAGSVLGTLPYMAPEQMASLPSGTAGDVFSAGLMLHEAIHGRRDRPSVPVGWIARTCLERLPPLATLYPEVPRGLSRLIEEMLALEPSDRPTAAQAANTLRSLAFGEPSAACPAPTWVHPGPWYDAVEDVLGYSHITPVRVLEGPSGSGKRRAAEQVQRSGILQGMRPLTLRCRVERVGGILEDLLAELLPTLSDEASQVLAGADGPLLRRVWPGLALPGAGPPHGFPSVETIARTVARCCEQSAEDQPLLLVVEDVDQIDTVSARGLVQLAERASAKLILLLLHDPRWATPESTRCVARLEATCGALRVRVPPLESAAATAIATSLCPSAPPRIVPVNTPLQAVAMGLEALARWRGEPWSPPGTELWPLALRDAPIPTQVLHEVDAAQVIHSPWVKRTDAGLALATAFARDAARARLSSKQVAGRALAAGWARALPDDNAEIAALHVIAGDPRAAWTPCSLAAVNAERLGDFDAARRWLFLIDTLPRPEVFRAGPLFDVAVVRARVALSTEPGEPRRDLLQAVDELAVSDPQPAIAKLLRAEFDLRDGQATRALIAALRVASTVRETSPHLAVQALLDAIQCRFVLDQLDDVPQQISTASELLAANPNPLLNTQLGNLRAEHLFRTQDLTQCRKQCQLLIRQASEQGYLRGTAFAASRLGRVLRRIGRRHEAEVQTRSARVAFASTGDRLLDAETGLALATLLVERGDTTGARRLLDDAIRQIRGLHLDDLLPGAMRVSLEIAIFRSDTALAAVALSELAASVRHADEELPSVLMRWWRVRGDLDRALAVEPPRDTGYGRALWLVERARVAMVSGNAARAATDAREALALADHGGFGEVHTYARLLLGLVDPSTAADWSVLQDEASNVLRAEVFLGALEFDARLLTSRGALDEAASRWRILRARSHELGYLPGVDEALGWLASS